MSVYTIAITDLLLMDSGDASAYDICSECGASTRNYCGDGIINHYMGCSGTSEVYTGSIVGDALEIKRFDPGYAELVEDMRKRGQIDPIYICGETVYNGHHRIAALVDIGAQFVTVNDEFDESCENWTSPNYDH